MAIRITKKNDQGVGAFNGGAILENKPIGFPQDGGKEKPYSNLFYWAHAWTPGAASLIGEHPHNGFEIMSFVLEGTLEHYDSKYREWKTLNTGDAQIIRSGNGITHAEKVLDNSAFFQIWIDPNLSKTLTQPASYDDYASDQFPVVEENGVRTKTYTKNGSPMTMDTPGLVIQELNIEAGEHQLDLDENEVHSFYMISGEGKLNEAMVEQHDFAVVAEEKSLKLKLDVPVRIFRISSPAKLDYLTYSERMQMARF